MGTTYTVRVVSPPSDLTAHDIRSLIEDELRIVDVSMSSYRADSEISRFNSSSSTEWFATSAELARVVSAALEVGRASKGAFDITVGPLVRVWGFGPDSQQGLVAPDERALAEVRTAVGLEHLEVRGDLAALRKDVPQVQIDLNGIAPGYAVDRIAMRLERLDIRSYLVDIGGEVRMRGHNREGELWRIAVERPEEMTSSPAAALRIDSRAVATSGGYRHYIERHGKRLAHTIDPRTGMPIERIAASAVVIHDEAMYADAWATAMNVLGPDEGYALAMQHGLAVMFIIDSGGGAIETKTTPAFEPYVTVFSEHE